MKRYLLFSVLCALLFMGCNNTPEESNEKTTYSTLLVASKYGYVIDGCSCLPTRLLIIREIGENGKWKQTPILEQNVLKYETGYEYTVRAHKEVVNPESKPEKHVLWWKFDEVLSKVQKDTELPDDIYLYTIGSPWGLDPRDPMLEYMLEHYKEIFGEDCEIYYPTE